MESPENDRAPEGGEVELFSPDHSRTFCFIEDAVEQIIGLAEHPDAEGGTFNVGNQEPEVLIRDLAALLAQTVGKDIRFREQPPTLGSPVRRCPDTSKTIEVTGCRSHFDLEQGVARTSEWYWQQV